MNPALPPFDWGEYLRQATALSQNADEASHRTSISRAYYSIFHAATIHAQNNGYSGHSHKKLWATYQGATDRNCRRLSTLGNQMKAAREDADYVGVVLDVPDVMTQQLQDAATFINTLAEVPATSPEPLRPSPPRTCPNCGVVL
jgi:uncharacterized protein (UPF0332 family)